jgi:hypothetical protein
VVGCPRGKSRKLWRREEGEEEQEEEEEEEDGTSVWCYVQCGCRWGEARVCCCESW